MPNLEVQAPNIGVHIPILGVPAPNLGVPGTDVAISAPNTAVQAPGPGVPAPNQAPRLRFPDLWIQSRGAGSPISGCGSWLWGGGVSTRFAGCSGGWSRGRGGGCGGGGAARQPRSFPASGSFPMRVSSHQVAKALEFQFHILSVCPASSVLKKGADKVKDKVRKAAEFTNLSG